MSDSLRRALAQLRNPGGATVWCPNVMRGQGSSGEELIRRLGSSSSGSLVSIQGSEDLAYEANVIPSLDGWEDEVTGDVTETCSGSILHTVVASTNSIYHWRTLDTADQNVGMTLAARVRITSATAGTNRGLCLSLRDGTYQSTLWLRPTGLNIDGAVDANCVLDNAYHVIRFSSQRGYCRAYLDDMLLQYGTYMNSCSEKGATFGSWTTVAEATTVRSKYSVVADVDWVRVRLGV